MNIKRIEVGWKVDSEENPAIPYDWGDIIATIPCDILHNHCLFMEKDTFPFVSFMSLEKWFEEQGTDATAFASLPDEPQPMGRIIREKLEEFYPGKPVTWGLIRVWR